MVFSSIRCDYEILEHVVTETSTAYNVWRSMGTHWMTAPKKRVLSPGSGIYIWQPIMSWTTAVSHYRVLSQTLFKISVSVCVHFRKLTVVSFHLAFPNFFSVSYPSLYSCSSPYPLLPQFNSSFMSLFPFQTHYFLFCLLLKVVPHPPPLPCQCPWFLTGFLNVLASFMSSWINLESLRKKDSQLRKCFSNSHL